MGGTKGVMKVRCIAYTEEGWGSTEETNSFFSYSKCN